MSEPRQLKELRKLMPWTWDSKVETHPPGAASMRDFQVCSYETWSDGKTRRGRSTPSIKSEGRETSARNSSGRKRKSTLKEVCTNDFKKRTRSLDASNESVGGGTGKPACSESSITNSKGAAISRETPRLASRLRLDSAACTPATNWPSTQSWRHTTGLKSGSTLSLKSGSLGKACTQELRDSPDTVQNPASMNHHPIDTAVNSTVPQISQLSLAETQQKEALGPCQSVAETVAVPSPVTLITPQGDAVCEEAKYGSNGSTESPSGTGTVDACSTEMTPPEVAPNDDTAHHHETVEIDTSDRRNALPDNARQIVEGESPQSQAGFAQKSEIIQETRSESVSISSMTPDGQLTSEGSPGLRSSCSLDKENEPRKSSGSPSELEMRHNHNIDEKGHAECEQHEDTQMTPCPSAPEAMTAVPKIIETSDKSDKQQDSFQEPPCVVEASCAEETASKTDKELHKEAEVKEREAVGNDSCHRNEAACIELAQRCTANQVVEASLDLPVHPINTEIEHDRQGQACSQLPGSPKLNAAEPPGTADSSVDAARTLESFRQRLHTLPLGIPLALPDAPALDCCASRIQSSPECPPLDAVAIQQPFAESFQPSILQDVPSNRHAGPLREHNFDQQWREGSRHMDGKKKARSSTMRYHGLENREDWEDHPHERRSRRFKQKKGEQSQDTNRSERRSQRLAGSGARELINRRLAAPLPVHKPFDREQMYQDSALKRCRDIENRSPFPWEGPNPGTQLGRCGLQLFKQNRLVYNTVPSPGREPLCPLPYMNDSAYEQQSSYLPSSKTQALMNALDFFEQHRGDLSPWNLEAA